MSSEKKRADENGAEDEFVLSDADKAAFDALTSNEYNFCLIACRCNGTPTSAICLVTPSIKPGETILRPLFIAFREDMDIEDSDGDRPERASEDEQRYAHRKMDEQAAIRRLERLVEGSLLQPLGRQVSIIAVPGEVPGEEEVGDDSN